MLSASVSTRLAWAVLAFGIALSASAGLIVRLRVQEAGVQAFQVQAGDIGERVTSTLRRIDDLASAEAAFISSDGSVDNRTFATWFASMAAGGRYPGVLGMSFIQYVPAKALPSFAAALRADPGRGASSLPGPLIIFPPGPRPAYCLTRLRDAPGLLALAGSRLARAGLDVCAVPGGDGLLRARDMGALGSSVFTPLPSRPILLISLPVFTGGLTPATVAERRSQLRGWVLVQYDVTRVLGAALGAQRGVEVSVYRRLGPSVATLATVQGSVSPIARAGQVTSRAAMSRSFAVSVNGAWVVQVRRAAPWGALSPTLQGLLVLVGGTLVALLSFALVQVVSSGRARALGLLAERTRELHHQAFHDALTGLPNRALIMDRAKQLLARARRQRTQATALFIDLDNFKGVNDTFGHAVGDQLLCEVAERISSVVRESETVGRLAGDEFVALLEPGVSAHAQERIAERLLDVLRTPFLLRQNGSPMELRITASIGIASVDGTPDGLLHDADIALYQAKEAGGDRYVVFQRVMHAAARDRRQLENDLRLALAREELLLVYQPIVDLADGAVTGAEALLRWRHPTRGIVPPTAFIPLAEESGSIVAIGAWALRAACERVAACHARGHRIDVSVNVSGRQLDDPSLVHSVSEALATSGLPAASLIIEITETVLMRNPAAAAERLRALKELGVRLAIDDFGTGYSALAYLQDFPVDVLKIDRAFVSAIGESAQANTLIHTLMQMSTAMELVTVAEGIEHERQLDYLRAEGCPRGQGFLFSRPLHGEALDAALSRSLAVRLTARY
jgi:diguanylate cyclase (GGDEF)-like protein